jgi:hypothetical protein
MPGNVMLRLSSAIVALMILGMIYSRARDPRTWRWMAPEDDVPPVAAIPAQAGPNAAPPAPTETVVEGPTDLDELNSPEVQTQFAAIGEKSELALEEMPAYWRLMKWSRAQTFDELQTRAARDVLYIRFFEEPEKYRGVPVRLRLHIKQIISWDAPENSAGVKTVYEVSGATEDSDTFYYIVVCPELPAGMRTGTKLDEEGVFVGYFLKVMPYQAAVKRLAAPLMIGRLRAVPRVAAPPAPSLPPWVWMASAVVVLAAAAWGWKQFAHAPPRRKVQTADVGDEETNDWFSQPLGDGASNENPPSGPGAPP